MDSIRNLRHHNSLSCPSEPPDVGNWFSSYEYRSPDPDSNFTREDSAFIVPDSQGDEEEEADFEKIQAGEEEAVKDDNHTKDTCFIKNVDSSSSCSLFSEPRDIRNWFSSNFYESSASETINPSGNEEVSEENRCGDERVDFEAVNKDEVRSENVHPKDCVEHNSSDRNMKGDGRAEMKENLPIANTSHLEKILQPCMQDKALQHNLGPTKYVETFSLNDGTPSSNREAHLMSFNNDAFAMTPPKKKLQKHDTKEVKSKAQIQADKLDNNTALDKNFSSRRSTCTRNKEKRSPDPDLNFSLEDSVFMVPDSQRDEEQEADFNKIQAGEEGAVKDDNHNQDTCLTKNLDSSSSCSLFSEPPDIRNWFSSYVYESSASDTISLFKNEEVSEENKHEDERFDFEVVNEDEGRSENVHPRDCVEHNSSSDKNMKGDGSAQMKENLTNASTPQLENILQPCMQDKALQPELGPTKYVETLSLNHGTPGFNREPHLMSLDMDAFAMTAPKQVHKHDTKEAKSKAHIQADKLVISAALDKSFSSRSSTCTRNKENNGFVTTRKNSCTIANDENSCKKPEKILLQCPTNTGRVPLARENNGVTKRKALAEATNLQQSNAMEITGKWQCPQKRKPHVGPALKQLRLERWVRKDLPSLT